MLGGQTGHKPQALPKAGGRGRRYSRTELVGVLYPPVHLWAVLLPPIKHKGREAAMVYSAGIAVGGLLLLSGGFISFFDCLTCMVLGKKDATSPSSSETLASAPALLLRCPHCWSCGSYTEGGGGTGDWQGTGWASYASN